MDQDQEIFDMTRGQVVANQKEIDRLRKENNTLISYIQKMCLHERIVMQHSGVGFDRAIGQRGICIGCTLEESGRFVNLAKSEVIATYTADEYDRYRIFRKLQSDEVLRELIASKEAAAG